MWPLPCLLVFRSIVVPIKATLGFLLTIGSTFGALVAIFQWGWLASLLGVNQPAPIIAFLPIILIAILFGLAMDYQMFLVSGMREGVSHGEDARTAVKTGAAAVRPFTVMRSSSSTAKCGAVSSAVRSPISNGTP